MKKLLMLLLAAMLLLVCARAEMADVVITLPGQQVAFTPLEGGVCLTRESSASAFNKAGLSQREVLPYMEEYDLYAMLFDAEYTLEMQLCLYEGGVADYTGLDAFAVSALCDEYESWYAGYGYEVRSIDTLQQTIRMLEATPGSAVPSRNIKKRQILTIPFDEVTTCDRYNHKLLALFVEAQRNGIMASYPSGLLYEGIGKKVQKYVFVHADFSSATPEALEKLGARTLPEGSYYVKKEGKHQIEQAASFFPPLLNLEKKDHYLLVETDLLKEDIEKSDSDASLELQLLFLKK